jgi:ribosomal protein L30/L7E
MRTVYLDRSLAAMPPTQRKAWATWLDQHGLDPNDVLVGRDLVCDDNQRRVYYTAIDRERPVINGEINVIHRYVQLEAPALPLPT